MILMHSEFSSGIGVWIRRNMPNACWVGISLCADLV